MRPALRRLLAVVGALAAALLVVAIALDSWLSAAGVSFTVVSLVLTWRTSRRADREHRAAFEARLDAARRPPSGRDTGEEPVPVR